MVSRDNIYVNINREKNSVHFSKMMSANVNTSPIY